MRWIVAALTGVAVLGVVAVLFPHDDEVPGSEQLPDAGTSLTGFFDRVKHDAKEPSTGISGRARVIDGDSVYVGDVEVRLFGVDAPEAMQTCVFGNASWPCGRQATQALRDLVEGRIVTCDERDQDVHGRVVAVCRQGGVDINAWLVANGWAMAYVRYGHDYVEAEAEAKSAKRGMWRGELTAPWDWRASEAPPRTAAMAQPAGCNIKGNISMGSGKRYYHEPGDRDYAKTRINRRGERWFCSAAEARAAGWQPANPAKR